MVIVYSKNQGGGLSAESNLISLQAKYVMTNTLSDQLSVIKFLRTEIVTSVSMKIHSYVVHSNKLWISMIKISNR